MIDPFSVELRRDPYPIYSQLRRSAPLVQEPGSGLWMAFDYATVKRVLSDQELFSSRAGPDWLIFSDPPRHTRLRGLVAKAFTPRSVANLEGRIAELSRSLLEPHLRRGHFDLAADYAAQLPLLVIAQMLGIPAEDQPRFQRWNDATLRMSLTIVRHDETTRAAMDAFRDVTVEISDYLSLALKGRKADAENDLLSRLASAELDGERLSHADIVGSFQLLLLGGSETTTNLISNAMLCFGENPPQDELLRASPDLLPTSLEEVLRYRSPVQWVYRVTRDEVMLQNRLIPARTMVLAMIGSANRDETQFDDAAHFNIKRNPNPHIAFSNGIHFCMGAPLARLEAKIAWTDLMRLKNLRRANDELWMPREGLNVHGPTNLPVRFEPAML